MPDRSQVDHEPLFIVDNADGGRNGLGYLQEWCELATQVDIATGFFEIGSLLGLNGYWQKLDHIRLLMGSEISHRSKKILLTKVLTEAEVILDESLEAEKDANPFLTGVPAIVDGISSGKIECRVYDKAKFHAKAYITHGRFDVIGSQALVGSSNFTLPGLTQNVELNIKLESSSEVAQLQRWYEAHWDDAAPVSDAVLQTIARHTTEYSPFEVYLRSLHELFRDQEPTLDEWELERSKIFPKLDRYQQEGYRALMSIAKKHRGAFLCDGVGLGKTYIGLMLIERLVLHENKRVALFAPKAVKDAVWAPELNRHLGHIGGIDGSADFSNLSVFSHTDLTRTSFEYPERFERVTELADVVIVDEAHHFRNTGSRGNTLADRDERSRYYRLFDIIAGGPEPKTVFFLTATPINNSLNDFRHLAELFTQGDDSAFARTLAVPSMTARLNRITKDLKQVVGEDADLGEVVTEAQELLAGDDLFQGLVVQRSRAYARASQIQEKGDAAVFPVREDPKVANYSIKKSYGALLDLVDKAFEKQKPLFALPMYYPLAYYIGPDPAVDPIEENRQRQVVGLIRTNFLKRFESSVFAFERSCARLMQKLIAFWTVNVDTPGEKKVFDRWLDQHADVLAWSRIRQLALWGEDEHGDEDDDEDVVPAELLAKFEKLDRTLYDVPQMIDETHLDLAEITKLLTEAKKFEPKHDDKLKRLLKLINRDVAGRKVIVFTEFADTARYLVKQLEEAGVQGMAQLDSGRNLDRADIIKRFSPYYNGTSSAELAKAGKTEINVLISTDVLSEGLNLQDATRLVNYDIHWNPVRLMQRIGRVDRRLNPDVETTLVAENPEVAKDRGKVAYWNFLPPSELDDLLRLYSNVSHKTLLISKTLGIEGKKLLSPDDDFEALKEFNAQYEGEETPVEQLHLEYQRLVDDHPEVAARLDSFPGAVFSGRAHESLVEGVFLCLRLPALDAELETFTLEAGVTHWYFADLGGGEVLDTPEKIAQWIRSAPDTPRDVLLTQERLVQVRDDVLKHVKNTYLKRIDAPLDAPKPRLVSWMVVGGSA
jgi:superfamily II DNA or RNA helicase